MKQFFFAFAAVMSVQLSAQLPVVNQPVFFAPAETVYLAPNGSDLNSGSQASPLKTFYAALQHISWGVPNVNGGNAYAEVVLLPGDYYPAANTGFVQTVNEWRQNVSSTWVYKNVSIRGSGTVRIHGDSLATGNQMIYLVGNHIKVTNLQIMNCPLHGIYFDGSPITHNTDVLVDSVTVDHVFGFGIFFSGYDRVQATHCTVNNTCRQNANEINGTCQWPSGLRADNCNHVTFTDNIVSNNWGEGLNTSYCRYVDVSDNAVFDNYSVNIYCHSASKAMYRNNLVYNSDSAMWRYCYNSNGSSAFGITIANELSCTVGCFLYTNGCGSSTSCCSYTDYDHPLNTPVNYYMVDSVFIYNNLLFEAGINIFDAFSSFGNYAYINHLYIEHNTVIGRAGSAAVVKSPLILTLGTPFIHFANVRVRNNIFSIDNTLPQGSDFFAYAAANSCNGAWTNNFTSTGNLWKAIPTVPGVSFAADAFSATLATHAVAGDTANLIPSPLHPELVMPDPAISYITEDYFHYPRIVNTNAGAIEYDVNNAVAVAGAAEQIPFVFPNPARSSFTLRVPAGGTHWMYSVSNAVTGQTMIDRQALNSSVTVSTAEWADGVYLVHCSDGVGVHNLKVVVCR